MSDLNKVMLIGRLTKNPELRTLGETSQTVCSFSVATSSNWKDKTGVKQEKTEFHNITVFGKLADICGKYLLKGKKVFVEGRLQTDSWDDKTTGQKKYKTNIILENMQMLDSIQSNTNTNAYSNNDEIDLGGI